MAGKEMTAQDVVAYIKDRGVKIESSPSIRDPDSSNSAKFGCGFVDPH